MSKRLQIVLSEEAKRQVERITRLANENFENGSVSLSDVVSEMVLTANIDIEKLQLKHINIRKSLRLLASQKDLDVDTAIESLLALKKGNTKKRKPKPTQERTICPAT